MVYEVMNSKNFYRVYVGGGKISKVEGLGEEEDIMVCGIRMKVREAIGRKMVDMRVEELGLRKLSYGI